MMRLREVLTAVLSLAMLAGSVTLASEPKCFLTDAECKERKNVILIVADDLGWEDLPFFSAPIRWPEDNPNSEASQENKSSYNEIRTDWNRLAARMLAEPKTTGTCGQKKAGYAAWPNPLLGRGTTTPPPTVPQYPVIAEDYVDDEFEPEDVLYQTETGTGCPAPPSRLILANTGALNFLRQRGATVPRFYTTGAVCGPSRYSMMTGRQWQRVHGGGESVDMNGDTQVTIAERLDDIIVSDGPGSCVDCPKYKSAYFGKWHLGSESTGGGLHNSPWENGFDYGVAHEGNKLGDTVSDGEKGMACRGIGGLNECMGPGDCVGGCSDPSAGCCFGASGAPANGSGRYKPKVSTGAPCERDPIQGSQCDNSTRVYTELALRFLDKWDEWNGQPRTDKDKFFLVIAYPAVHNGAVGAPAHSKAHYSKSGINGAYFAAIEEMDAAVGRLKAKLVELSSGTTDLLDQTLIFYTSDNGGVNRTTGFADLTGNKRSSLEGGIRVGLVAHTNHATPGVTLPPDFVMTGVDLFPTIAAAGKVEVPDSGFLNEGPTNSYPIDGYNFLELLTNGSSDPEDSPRDFGFSRGKGSAIIAKQIPINIDSTKWPQVPSSTQGRGVCAYVDPLIYDVSPASTNPLLPVYGTHLKCKPCDHDNDCDAVSNPTIDDPTIAGPDCVITSSENRTEDGKYKVGKQIACNRCVPARWKVRSNASQSKPTGAAPKETREQLFELNSDPTETNNCATERQDVWYELKCKLWRWHKCVNAQQGQGPFDGGANRPCERDDMDESYASSGGTVCPDP